MEMRQGGPQDTRAVSAAHLPGASYPAPHDSAARPPELALRVLEQPGGASASPPRCTRCGLWSRK